MKGKRTSSIRRQFSLIFIGVMAGTILLCLLMNSLFLVQYYVKSKERVIFDAYEKIKVAANSDSYGSQEFRYELDDICRNSNITVCIIDANSQIQYVSVNGGKELEASLIRYIFGIPAENVSMLQNGKDWVLQQVGKGTEQFLEMFGRLDTGVSFILRTPIESIKESAEIAERFFTYVGILGVIAGAIIIWFTTRKITKPISKLNHISERMVHLDFDVKYDVKGHNEIDQLGENINKLSESLERSISELKTANNELKKDIEKKEQIDEMRKEFLSNVSHELKTPIALIQGYAEGLREGINDDAESREFYCEVIMDEAAKMNHMVKKLLTLNQLEFGNEMVDMERFDVVAMIRNYIQSAMILAKQNQIEIRMADYVPVYVWADEFKVEEVFTNYFSNAVNHCAGENKVIDVKVEQRSGIVRISVFNTGAPIPEESVPYIWDKFYKVDKARTREYGGSGVGLSIVKAIMESMNQQYGVENYNNGVLFWFELETVQE